MWALPEDWVDENYIKGTKENTTEGMEVFVRGYDGVDEVLFPHRVLTVKEDTIISIETNPQSVIPLSERGSAERSQWYIKKKFKN
ncbi:hypothetical protein [Bacillus phage BC-T25]|nr:hypothetical protein [Bacillus phage BC-T25]